MVRLVGKSQPRRRRAAACPMVITVGSRSLSAVALQRIVGFSGAVCGLNFDVLIQGILYKLTGCTGMLNKGMRGGRLAAN